MSVSVLHPAHIADDAASGGSTKVADFDKVPTHGGDFFVPFNYKHLTWSLLWGVMDPDQARPGDTTSGFHHGVTSGDQIAYIRDGRIGSISARSFDVHSVQMTAAFDISQNVKVVAFSHGERVYDHTFSITDAHPTLLTLDLVGIDNLYFIPGKGVHDDQQSERGSQIIIDDLTISNVKNLFSSDAPAVFEQHGHLANMASYEIGHTLDALHPVALLA